MIEATEKGCWNSGLRIEKCGYTGQVPIRVVRFSLSAYLKVQAMMQVMNNSEWLAYLVGRRTRRGYTVDDIYVPLQEVTGTSVDVGAEQQVVPNTLGTIHSHHSMGAFVSGTDEKFLISNDEVVIICSDKGWEVRIRSTLPCGALTAAEGSWEVQMPRGFDEDAFILDSVARITRKSYTSPVQAWKKPEESASGELLGGRLAERAKIKEDKSAGAEIMVQTKKGEFVPESEARKMDGALLTPEAQEILDFLGVNQWYGGGGG